MNASSAWLNDDEIDYEQGTYARRDKSREQRMRRHSYERRSARPSSVNGIHRRRNKRFAW